MNASPITKITSWLEFLGKNLHFVGCATVCGKSEVMLTYILKPKTVVVKNAEVEDPLYIQLNYVSSALVCGMYIVPNRLQSYSH